MYKVKEIYYSLQGEGYHTGRPSIFLRFSGCNLWTGREQDRDKAICKFCDTDFWGMDGVNGGKYKSKDLVAKCKEIWATDNTEVPFIICTGGEPALQLDQELVDQFHLQGCEVAIETNGTLDLPNNIDWVCVSPKANTEIVIKKGNELKLVYPQEGILPIDFENYNFSHYYLQPMDSPLQEENTWKAIRYCKNHPKWKLSIQTHKFLNIP